MTPLTPQLPLGLTLRDSATFENFYAGPNAQLVSALAACAEGGGERFIYLWGGEGSGKTHLLQATAQAAGSRGTAVAYLPFGEAGQLVPDVLVGLETLSLVCLDDLHVIAGEASWEAGLFDLFNRLWEAGTRLVVAAAMSPGALPIALADLKSRLSSGLTYPVQGLDDEQKIQALRLRALRRGFDLPEDVGRYLLRRLPRDMSGLFAVLDHLDHVSLAAQRRLTIPFIKSVLEG